MKKRAGLVVTQEKKQRKETGGRENKIEKGTLENTHGSESGFEESQWWWCKGGDGDNSGPFGLLTVDEEYGQWVFEAGVRRQKGTRGRVECGSSFD